MEKIRTKISDDTTVPTGSKAKAVATVVEKELLPLPTNAIATYPELPEWANWDKSKQLSYSSLTLFNSCTRKYFFKKIAKVPQDPVPQDTTAFDYGKLVHLLLEVVGHRKTSLSDLISLYFLLASHYVRTPEFTKKHSDAGTYLFEDLDAIPEYVKLVDFYGVEKLALVCLEKSEVLRAIGSAYNYLEAYGLDASDTTKRVVTELPLYTETFQGYIDAVIVDTASKTMDIVDVKTAASVADYYIEKQRQILSSDPQLSLYGYYIRNSVNRLNPTGTKTLPISNFRYRVVGKASIKMKSKETIEEYINRCLPSLNTVEFVIPYHTLLASTDEVVKLHQSTGKKIEALKTLSVHDAYRVPCNRKNCYDFNRPCEWLSQCHAGNETVIVNRSGIK